MAWSKLTDSEWESIKGFFPPASRVGRPPTCRRQSIDGILWVLHNDAPWRNLPKEFGAWRTIYGLCKAWSESGTLGQVIRQLGFVIPPHKAELVAQVATVGAEASHHGSSYDDASHDGASHSDEPFVEEDGSRVRSVAAVAVGVFGDSEVRSSHNGSSHNGSSHSDGRLVEEDDTAVRSDSAAAAGVFDKPRARVG